MSHLLTLTFQGLGGELFILIGDHVDAKWELIDARLLATQVVNTDLRIGDTSAKEEGEGGRGREKRKRKRRKEW